MGAHTGNVSLITQPCLPIDATYDVADKVVSMCDAEHAYRGD
jgi:hypothetical protein